VQELLTLLNLGSFLELLGVIFALGYTVLAIKRVIWCWLCALFSGAIYFWVFYGANLYMQVALQIFYMAMAAVGYRSWRAGRDQAGVVEVMRWPAAWHGWAVLGIGAIGAINGWLLARNTGAALPYLDAWVTWGSVLATWLAARRVLENWLYWIVLDAVATYMYFVQHLTATGVLFLVYTVMAYQGFRAWQRHPQHN
jgi:nicotinamide mononucleotide transporter